MEGEGKDKPSQSEFLTFDKNATVQCFAHAYQMTDG